VGTCWYKGGHWLSWSTGFGGSCHSRLLQPVWPADVVKYVKIDNVWFALLSRVPLECVTRWEDISCMTWPLNMNKTLKSRRAFILSVGKTTHVTPVKSRKCGATVGRNLSSCCYWVQTVVGTFSSWSSRFAQTICKVYWNLLRDCAQSFAAVSLSPNAPQCASRWITPWRCCFVVTVAFYFTSITGQCGSVLDRQQLFRVGIRRYEPWQPTVPAVASSTSPNVQALLRLRRQVIGISLRCGIVWRLQGEPWRILDISLRRHLSVSFRLH